jgi:tetratricopeptide (TPR) repeat protein
LAATLAAAIVVAGATSSAQDLSDTELARWTSHVMSLERRVSRNADDAALMTRLTAAYVHIADVRRALPALERLADLRVPPVRLALLRGDLFMRAGDFDQAARAYLDALGRAPRQTHALVQLWRLLLRVTLEEVEVGFDREAVTETLTAAGLYFPESYRASANGPDQAARLVDRAGALLLRDRPEEASVQLMRAIDLDPGNAEAFAGLVRAHRAMNDPESALGAALVYLLLAPDAPDAPRMRELVGRVLEQTRRR